MAGLSIAFITIIVSTSVANATLYAPVRWGDVAIALLGLSSVFYVAAADFFLRAKEFNLYDLPDEYRKHLEAKTIDWGTLLKQSDDSMRKHEGYGRQSYNAALLLMFTGLLFVIGPYNLVVAIIVSGSGWLYEAFQAFR